MIKQEDKVIAVITFDPTNIPLYGRDGKYMVGLNNDQAYVLEDQGKITIKDGKAYQK